MERHVVAGRELVELAVVRDDGADVEREQAALPAKQQVVQAVPLLAHHEDGAHRLRHGVQPPLHFERLRKHVQLRFQVFGRELRAGELHAHEEQTRVMVVVLGRLFDVAAAFEQEARDGMHESETVRAGQGQDVDRFHRPALSPQKRVAGRSGAPVSQWTSTGFCASSAYCSRVSSTSSCVGVFSCQAEMWRWNSSAQEPSR